MNIQIDPVQWQHVATEIVRMPFPRQTSTLDLALAIASAAIGFVTVMTVLAKTQRLSQTGWLRTLVISLIGVVLLLLILVPFRLYVLPSLSGPEVQKWAFQVAAAAAILLVIVPILGKLHHMNYVQSLINTVLSVAVAALLVLLVSALMAAARGEKTEFGKIRDRKNEVEGFIRR